MTEELTDNIIQLFIVMLCGIYSCYRALKLKSKNWIPVTLFNVSFGIGLLYWVLYIVLFGSTPRVFCVSELSWTASYVFLAIRLTYNMTEEEKNISTARRGCYLFFRLQCAFSFASGEAILKI